MTKVAKEKIPISPGVYLFKNKNGGVLYVGKAANLKNRISSYFQKNSYLSPPKQRLIREASRVDWEETPSEIEALLLESHYIKKYQPRYNVLLRDDKTYISVKITDEEYPRVLTTRKIEKDGTYFGPFTDARAVKETLKILRRLFPYRTTCVPFVAPRGGAKQGSPFVAPRGGAKQGQPNSGRACLYYHLGLCPGVCIGKIGAKEYQQQIKHIKDFFAGKRQRILSNLRHQLKILQRKSDEQSIKLAENTEPRTRFAGALARRAVPAPPLRGTGAWVEYRIKNLEKVLMMARVLSFGEKVEGDVIELAKVLGLKKPPHRIEGYDVSNIMGTLATASMVVFTDGAVDKNEYRKFKINTVRGANDVAMLQEVLRRRFGKHRALAPRSPAVRGEVGWPLPDLVIIDGGRPQLGAAMEVWRECGLKIPLVSLAKRYEEIFVPEKLHPIVLPRTSPALHLVERVRDEAHRFAVSYHKLLRRKRFLQQ